METTRLFDIIRHQQASFPRADALVSKINGTWVPLSTVTVIERAEALSLALIDMGIGAGDKVALISENRPEWNIVDLAVLQIGAVLVPIYPTITSKDYLYIFQDAHVRLCFVSDDEMYQKVHAIEGELEGFLGIRSFDPIPNVTGWMEPGPEQKADLASLQSLMKEVKGDDLATLIYTSGTTGTPKGVMLSHKNILSNVKSTLACLPIKPSHRTLSFLPLCHIFERMVTYTYQLAGCGIYYAESLETIGDNLKEVKPHYFTAVPRLLEKVYDKIIAKGSGLAAPLKALFFWAVNLGLKYPDNGQLSSMYKFKLGIARKLIFKKWKAALGGEVEGIVTGAAALQPRLSKVFSAAGIRVREGYGQTETSPVLSFNRFEEGDFLIGTVGPVIPDVEIKIAESGEILAKGPNIMMGYFNRPDLTKGVIDEEGWLHTGDIGVFVDGRFLKITDRLKELFKTSGGKYVAPQPIENKLKESRFVEQVLVIGEAQKFTGAIIQPAFEFCREWAERKGLAASTHAELAASKELHDRIREDIAEFNHEFSQTEQVKQFFLVPDEWGVETGELTPTMKVKRKVLLEKYRGRIEELYA